LLLDERFIGKAPIIVEQIFDIILELNREVMTILLVDVSKLLLSSYQVKEADLA
jgi:ABC-type branched-subunit amino acid transport system ATPase component